MPLILVKLPFPLTLGFKSMLQRGIETPDMDVRWVSSLSWYFLNFFGLNGLYRLILGSDNCMYSSNASFFHLRSVIAHAQFSRPYFDPPPRCTHISAPHPLPNTGPFRLAPSDGGFSDRLPCFAVP